MKTNYDKQKPSIKNSNGILLIVTLCLLYSFYGKAQNWATQVSGVADKLTSVYFTHPDTGHAVGDLGKILRTQNGGVTWTQQLSPVSSPANESVFFINGNIGYIAGRDFAGTCESNRIMVNKTTNAGTNWNCVTTGLPFNGAFLRGIHFPSANTGFAVGDMGTIITTANAGTTWANQAQPFFYNLRSVYFTSLTNGFAVGFNTNTNSGLILNTTNGGALWNSVASGTTQLNSVFFTGATTGYIVGDGGVILKTINSGASWVPLISGTVANLNGVFFLNATTGYIAGAGGLILKTTNSGTNWNPLTTNTAQNLNSVHFPAPGFGYAVGDNGTIIKTCPVTSFVTLTNTVCAGTVINFTNTTLGGKTYIWKDNLGPIALTFNTSKTYTNAGSYTVTLIADNGTCSDSMKQTITVNPLPTVNIVASPTVICAGQNATLTASGANTYTWNTGSTLTNITVNPTVTLTYTVNGTNANGCVNTSVKSLTVNPNPVLSLSSVSITCNGVCNGSITPTPSGGTGPYTYNPPVLNNLCAGPYSVTVFDSKGCTSMQTITVNQPAPLVVNATANPSVICTGNASTLNPIGAGGTGALTYTWNPGGVINASVSVSPTISTTYTVTVKDVNNCISASTKSLTVNALPTVNIAGTNNICFGTITNLIASGASTYTWNTGPTSPTIIVSPTLTTTYTVTGTGINGCKNIASKTVTVYPLPTLTVASTTSLLCNGQSASLTVTGNAITYNWNPGGPGTSIVVSPTTTSTYSVIGTDANGCSNTVAFTQSVSPCAGINEIQNSNTSVLIYPNPNNGSFTIKAQKETVLILSNEIGQELERIILNANNENTYKINGLKAGMYFIFSLDGRTKHKIVSME